MTRSQTQQTPDAGEQPAGTITTKQMRELHALLRDHGISGDNAVHDYIATWLAEHGHEQVESRRELDTVTAAGLISDLRTADVAYAEGALVRALVEIQKSVPVIAHTKTAEIETRGGGSYAYSYADLKDVSDAALPLLTSHKIAWVCWPRQAADGTGYELVGELLHVSGQSKVGALPLHGNDPQVIGAAITYFRRYLLGSMLGIITDADPDARATRGGAPRTQQWDGPSTLELLAQIDADGQVLGMTYEEATADFCKHRKVTVEQLDALDPWELSSYAEHLHTRAEEARARQSAESAYVGATAEELLAQMHQYREQHAPATTWEDFSAKFRAHMGGITVDDLTTVHPLYLSQWEQQVAAWISEHARGETTTDARP